jgi:TonB-linked SusC/RagA family outer membrane protein
MRKLVLLLLGILMLSGQLLAQSRTVTGKVTDANGNPVANASVLVKGTTVGTTTGEDGNFSLTLPENARTLVFSSVGSVTQEINIGNRGLFNITLTSDDKDLQEVVVVGYGTLKKKEVTGSIATVKGTALANLPVQSFDNSLGGRAPGVQITVPNGLVGAAPVFRIRGTNSLNLSSYPLVVVDGVPVYTGNTSSTFASSNILASINPNDIESVDILKDASATAIYGSRAAAGVVLVTTKKGKSGSAKVTYDGWAGSTSPYGLWDLLNAQQYMQHKNMALANAGVPTTGTGSIEFRPTNGPDGQPIDTRWYDYVYRKGFSHSHNVNISGGNQTTNYFFSVGYLNQEGILVQNDFNRKTVRLNVDHKPNKVVSLGGNVSYSFEETKAPNSGSIPGFLFSTAGLGRIPLITAPNVSPYNNDGSYNIAGNGLIGVMNNNAGQVGFYNPVPVIDLNRAVNENNRLLGNVYIGLKPFSWLTLRSQYGIDYLNADNELFYSPVHGDGFPRGLANSSLAKYRRWNWTNTAQFDKTFGENHNFRLLVGSEQQYSTSEGFGLQMQDIADPFYTDIQGSYLTPTATGRFRGENYLLSAFGRLNYDFNKKYYLAVNLRQDEYSAFGPGNKKGTFWGASVAYDMSRENFWENSGLANIFSTFKLKGSYGTVGNIGGIGDFVANSFYGGGLYGAVGSLTLGSVGNPILQWETSKKTDIGLDFGLFNDRITGEINYYRNDIDDLIYGVPQAPSRGIPGNSLNENIGSMYNRGMEYNINAGVIRNKDFQWNASFNITTLKNVVNELAPGVTQFVSASDLETVNITRLGNSIGSFFVVRTAGVNPENGNRIFINAAGQQVQYQHVVPAGQSRWRFMDGTPAPAVGGQDAVLYRPSQPRFFGGFENSFRYKNFDLGVLLTFQGGNYVYNGTQAGLRDQRFWNNSTDILRSWKKPGDVTDIPLAIWGDNVSNGSAFPIDVNVQKGDFIKVRNAYIGYSIPGAILSKARISNARFYVQGQNLAIFTNYAGPDPEVSSNGNGNTNPGVDRNTIANGRTITVGLNIGF